MAHPQGSPRGLFAKKRVQIPVGGDLLFDDYSATAKLVSADATGLVLAGGVKISNKANGVLTANSTGVVANAGVSFSGQAAHKITANSTGILIGSRYISTNTTGNSTT